jgi:hypothetical protein
MKQGFLRLPFLKKLILLSSLVAMISTVAPWYDQRNSVGIGDTYLGVQGPLGIIGLIVLGCAAVTFFNLFFPLLGRNFFNLKRKGGVVAMALGLESLLLLAVSNVIFYNPEFGLSISNKSTRFGMMMAFFSVGIMVVAGYFARKNEKNELEDSEEFVLPERNVGESVQSDVRGGFGEVVGGNNNDVPISYERPHAPVQTSLTDNVDPLTLDAKTRYKMMQSQMRYSSTARTNLWGSGNGSAFSSRGAEGESRQEPTDY